jgi:PIN domain nuclease of toxin-antitoxin system
MVVHRPVLLDTCAAIWLMNGAPMSQSSRDAIRTAQKARLGVFVSPITGWEIATLVRKSRIQLNRPPEVWFNSLLNLPGVRLTELSPAVLIASAFLPGDPPRDPADRIISATARAFGYTVITRDGKLISYAAAGHIETIRC